MAKAARTMDRRQVKVWFSGLTFEVQQSVLDEFSSSFATSKEAKIKQLENELQSLRGGKSLSAPRNSKAKRATKAKVSPKKGTTIPPKYRHPETGETWAGRGVHPTWMREYLKKRGRKLDDLLIKK